MIAPRQSTDSAEFESYLLAFLGRFGSVEANGHSDIRRKCHESLKALLELRFNGDFGHAQNILSRMIVSCHKLDGVGVFYLAPQNSTRTEFEYTVTNDSLGTLRLTFNLIDRSLRLEFSTIGERTLVALYGAMLMHNALTRLSDETVRTLREHYERTAQSSEIKI